MIHTSPYRILIAEDHELSRKGFVYLFKAQEKFRVVGEAEDGEQAVALADSERPDLIIMDLGMPVMDGIQATQLIKVSWPDCKILVLTSHTDEEQVIAAMASGADAYCLKDIKSERLLQVVEQVLDGALWIDPAIAKIISRHFVGASPSSSSSLLGLAPSSKREKYRLSLTEREMEVLAELAQGKSNKEIADSLCVTIHTVKSHVASIIQKLAVNDRTQVALKAIQEGLVNP